MATTKQQTTVRKNIKKAQATWRSMSKRARSLVQPEGKERKRPGMGGKGKYYRIDVRPKADFMLFRTQDVGEEGHLQRIAGKRRSGRWDTATWLISKADAHIGKNNQLVIDNRRARTALKQIRGPIMHKKGDVFEASPRQVARVR